jgi:hypothetical protein
MIMVVTFSVLSLRYGTEKLKVELGSAGAEHSKPSSSGPEAGDNPSYRRG